jgi:hypothetical protein
MKTATTAQVNASLLGMETGATALLQGIRVQRVSGQTWSIAGDAEMHLLTASDHVLKRAGFSPIMELESIR